MAGVILDRVSRVYPGAVKAVDQVSLDVRDREFLVLVGPSGCGKTTLLRMIAGLEEITSGEIRIAQRVVNQVAPKDRNIAMVFQNYALYPHMTVYKNMAFGLELRSGSSWLRRAVCRLVWPAKARELAETRAQIDRRVRETARSLGLEPLLDRLPRQLSGGERQRVALGRAIVRQPAAFLFDEPLSNLDAKLRVEMRRELKQLHRRLETTMIYVTHDQVEALTLGDRIAVMDRGVLQQVGTPLELYDEPRNRFVAGFLGTPGMNFVEGNLTPGGDGLQFQSPYGSALLDSKQALRVQPYVGRPVVLGVRPEDVRIEIGGAGRGRGSFAACVAVVETLGDASVLHLDTGPAKVGQAVTGLAVASLVAKVPARAAVKVGDVVGVEFEMRRAHVFDIDTGASLTWSPDAAVGVADHAVEGN